MAGANDAARSNDPDSQFMIIFVRHTSNAITILRNRLALTRDKFDRSATSPFKSTTNGHESTRITQESPFP